MKIDLNPFPTSLLAAALCFPIGLAAQNVTGKVVDENNQPLPYANVVLMALPDSTYVHGMVTTPEGRFSLTPTSKNQFVSISFVGYTPVHKPIEPADLGVVQLLPDAQVLGSVVVKGSLPVTRIKGDAMVTTVNGSVLEKVGTANDVLDKIPGVTAEDGAVKVFGSGAAVIYINGRKMENSVELDQLASDNIQHVEVVRNPGARYDASVKAVVRITTKKPQGEGFSFSNRLRGSYQYDFSGLEQLTMNYRKGGLDVSGMFYGSISNGADIKRIIQETHLDKLWRQDSPLETYSHRENIEGMLSVNYQFNPKHSIGVRYDIDSYPTSQWDIRPFHTEVLCDGALYEQSVNGGVSDMPSRKQSLNLYYVGAVGKWKLDFNADGYWGSGDREERMMESVTAADGTTSEQQVNTRSEDANTLYAARLVAERTLGKGALTMGADYSYSDVSNDFFSDEGPLSDADNDIREHAIAPFVEYAVTWGKVSLSAGLRYEHLLSDYFENGVRSDVQSRIYDNFFPSASVAVPLGKVQTRLSYSSYTSRPSYNMLRNSITYVNKYTYESGNPLLRPELIHKVALDLSYKWVYFNAGYIYTKDYTTQFCTQYAEDDPTITLFRGENVPRLDQFHTSLTLAPKVGWWSPQFTATFVRQWFDVATPDGVRPFNKPIVALFWNNAFELPKGFVLNVDGSFSTTGDQGNDRIDRPSGSLDLSLYKGFFNDRFTVLFQARDLLNTSRPWVNAYSGQRVLMMEHESRRSFMLTLRYIFNPAKSKYRGTGAGTSQRNRM